MVHCHLPVCRTCHSVQEVGNWNFFRRQFILLLFYLLWSHYIELIRLSEHLATIEQLWKLIFFAPNFPAQLVQKSIKLDALRDEPAKQRVVGFYQIICPRSKSEDRNRSRSFLRNYINKIPRQAIYYSLETYSGNPQSLKSGNKITYQRCGTAVPLTSVVGSPPQWLVI